MLNFLAMMGWSLDDSSEILSREQLLTYFTLERIHASPAVFDKDKLEWYNGMYIRDMDPKTLSEQLIPYLEADVTGLPASVARPIDREYLTAIVPLERERLKRLSEAPEMFEFFFTDDLEYDQALLIQKGMDADGARAAAEQALAVAEAASDWSTDGLEVAYRALVEETGLKAGQLFGTIRTAISGRTATPPLFDMMSVLGRERVIARLQAAARAR